MSTVVDIISQKDNLFHQNGVTEMELHQAEKELDLHFHRDYQEYLLFYGVASFGSHELTGICPFPRLNVVNVTKEERLLNPSVPQNYYVIEQANIDGIVIWQNSVGEVFQTVPNTSPVKIANSMSGYIESIS